MGQATEERMTTAIADTRDNLSRDVDALYDKVSPGRMVERRKEAVRGRLASLKDSVMGTTHDAAGSVQGAAGSVQSSAAGAVDATKDAAHSAVDTVQRTTEGAPLAAGLAAFGAGMVIAALIPASDQEAQAAHRLTEAVKDSPVIDQAKAVGQEMGEHLKDSATEAVDHVKASAQESVESVTDEGATAARMVKDDVPGT